jgi:hypothetical protein
VLLFGFAELDAASVVAGGPLVFVRGIRLGDKNFLFRVKTLQDLAMYVKENF